MAVREILHVGNPLLRERSREVTPSELATPELQTLIDTHALATWDPFERFHREAFVARITKFVERVGS
jgi:hypothetical protein